MPINIPAPQNLDLNLYQLISEILRRSTDGTVPLPTSGELIYTPVNASSSGRHYRIQIIEVTDPETQQISPVIQVIPA